MDYRIEELIDIGLFQELQDRLNEIYSFPSAIIDNEGTVHTATAWQDVCTKFHRVQPECAAACRASDLYILEHLAEAKPAVTYRCPHGLVDNATPIVIGGKHVANYFTGQFFLEPPDLDFFRRQARRYGFDEEAYLEAVRKVPIWSAQKLAQYLEFIKGFTEILCGIGLRQLREREAQRALAEKQAALEQLTVQLAQAHRLEAIGRLAGGVAHDFNNMLTVLFANIDGAVEKVDPSSPLREDLLEIRAMASRSADMTRQLLAFARRQPAAPRRVDLNDAVASMLRMLRRLLGEGIELVWRPTTGPVIVSIDPSQLDQILANLCVNARDATTGVGTVTLETRRADAAAGGPPLAAGLAPGRYAVLSITDTGPGMTREVQEHAFEPFFSTKPVGQGTGLGLATVYGIVNQNEGAIEIHSQPGHGTSFLIFLPLRAPDEASPASGVGAEPRPSPVLDATVLLVEDERSVRSVSRRVVERLGCHVLEAASPGEALRIATAHRGQIDLLLTDVVMPEMTGAELATEIGRLRPGLRVLFVSGYPAALASERGTLPESVPFLAKPFSPDELASKVREVLAR